MGQTLLEILAALPSGDLIARAPGRTNEILKPHEKSDGGPTLRQDFHAAIARSSVLVRRVRLEHEVVEVIGVRPANREDLSTGVHPVAKQPRSPRVWSDVEAPRVTIAADEEIEDRCLRRHR